MTNTLQFATRALLRSPAYAAATIATIALGIAANVVVFSVASAVLLRPMPYPHADELYTPSATHADPSGTSNDYFLTNLEYLRWRDQSRTLELAALVTQSAALTGAGDPETISVGQASATLFHVLGVAPEMGRAFSSDEDVSGSGVALISHAFWIGHMGGRRSVLDETIEISGEPHQIIGVMPAEFAPLKQTADAWVPIGITATDLRQPVNARVITVVGRARNGAGVHQISAEFQSLNSALTAELPDVRNGWGVHVQPFRVAFVGNARQIVLALECLVAFLGLLVCANVANLSMARFTTRRAESSLRAALGGGPWQLLQPILAETIVIAATSGVLGLVVARLVLGPIAALDGGATPLLDTATIDGTAVLVAAAVAIVSVTLAFLIPALRTLHDASGSTLLGSARGSTGSRADRLLGRVLMTVQVGLAVVLSIGATSAVGILSKLTRVAPGYDSHGVALASVTPPPERYGTHAKRAEFGRALEERGRAIPGIIGFSYVANTFLAGFSRQTSLTVDGRPTKAGDVILANYRRVGSGYFGTMRIPIRRGRALTAGDVEGTQPVAVVSESFARSVFPGEDAIGKRIARSAAPTVPLTIVGIAADVHDAGLVDDVSSTLYVPHAQLSATSPSTLTIVVRSSAPLSETRVALARAMHDVDRLVPIEQFTTLDARLAGSLSAQRFRSLLLTVFACLGLALAIVGVYGVTAYTVAQRAREVSIRMAVGARASDVLRMFGRETGVWLASGVMSGLVTTFVLVRIARSALANVVAVDVAVSLSVAALIIVVAAIATAIPARRATRIDPADALRASL
jgi:putative ABC transport system permease protein